MRFGSIRESIRELQDQLRDAKADLQGAILSNTWQLQMHTVYLTSHTLIKIPDLAQAQPTSTEPIQRLGMNLSKELSIPPKPGKNLPTITNIKRTLWYRGILGAVTVHTNSRYICQDRKATRKSRTTMSEKTIILVAPAFLNRQLEIIFTNTFERISRVLRTYPVIANFHRSEAQSCIAAGDLEALQLMFSSAAMSAFVLSEQGETLLHLAAHHSRPELCTFLTQLGVDPDRTSTYDWKAIHRVHCRTNYEVLDRHAVRVLVEAHNDFIALCCDSPVDVPIEAVHSFPSLDPGEHHISQGPEVDTTVPILAKSLAWSLNSDLDSMTFTRELLRKGADVHARVPRTDQTLSKPFIRLPHGAYGTALDELLAYASTPFEAREKADGW
ncbi:hypothetical protein N7G274_007564 [Stereocaulon virgatum]|uniref:Ankyrin n=1 Tax=Stereocaulon virgatum TaxID=373712 RepID=A0ABR4A3R1_9LECA